MLPDQSGTLPYLKSLSNCLHTVITGGYTVNFEVIDKGLYSSQTNQVYQPAEIKTMNFFHFEGLSAPHEKVVLYIIETRDGQKGTLVKSYDTYADPVLESYLLSLKRNRAIPIKNEVVPQATRLENQPHD